MATTMRFAYADPPYPKPLNGHPKARNNAVRYYGQSVEVNHEILIGTLLTEAPDGWALSTSTTALPDLLPFVPRPYRILSWVKRQSATMQWPMYSWEPVILKGGRKRHPGRHYPRDWHQADKTRTTSWVGAKPRSFCFWIFDCLGVEDGDEMWDVFTGSGAVGRCFDEYQGNLVDHSDLPIFDGMSM